MRLFRTIAGLSVLMCVDALAGWGTLSMPWAYEDQRWSAMTMIYDDTMKTTDHNVNVRAIVGHSKGGKQKIYIGLYKTSLGSMCNQRTQSSYGVAKIDGQAVRVMIWCEKYTDTDETYLSLTPDTQAGEQYVIQRFKSAAKSVWFSYDGYACPLSAKGFSKAWSSSGGNAL